MAGELGEHGTELAVLGPDVQGMVEYVHGFGLQQNRHRSDTGCRKGRGRVSGRKAAIPSRI